MRLSHLFSLASLAVVAIGLLGADECGADLCTDADGDAFALEGGSCGPIDCDDADPHIYPGAPERCGDVGTQARDDDCDGVSDEGCGPVNCAPLEDPPGWELCEAEEGRCGAVYHDGIGCAELCEQAGLVCAAVYEDLDGACAPDTSRPALTCDPPSGHQSDYCECVSPGECVPDCSGLQCGGDGCGGSCGTCGDDALCASGLCVLDQGSDAAFPGAEGEGMWTDGGRGGDVCHVTNMQDSGSGSLRECAATQTGALTIVFDVGGTITLSSPLKFTKDRLTIAGQTAPGDGVQIRGYQVQIDADDVIVQHLRFRAGDVNIQQCPGGTSGFTEDSLTLSGRRILVDHVSASWGIDENLSASGSFSDVTVQHSIISEGLAQTGLWHGECNDDYAPGGPSRHSMGSLMKPSSGDMNVSLHHNLYAHNGNRNPAVGTYETTQAFRADIRNNVIYDCSGMGYTSGASERGRVNYVGNYGVWGPSTSDDTLFDPGEDNRVELYQSDNRIDKDRDGQLDGFNLGPTMFGGTYSASSSPVSMRHVTTQPSTEAAEAVLRQAGARPWDRDAVDARIVADVRANTGGLIDSPTQVGGWDTLSPGARVVDTDRDGMPDSYERSNGTDPEVADNNGDADGDSYTNLENYLMWAGRFPR